MGHFTTLSRKSTTTWRRHSMSQYCMHQEYYVPRISYCLHNGLNRDSWPIIGGYFPRPRGDSLAPSDSGKTDGQSKAEVRRLKNALRWKIPAAEGQSIPNGVVVGEGMGQRAD